MSDIKNCEPDVDEILNDALKAKGGIFVLFYTSWCPFSRMFLPIFEKYAKRKMKNCLRVKVDDEESLMEKYSVDVVPTVLFFEDGTVLKRLDGKLGKGLTEKQLIDFINICYDG